MAQHRLSDGMNTYYLPLGTGRKKGWSTPENHMTCCLGTTMQANASYEGRIFYEHTGGLTVAQYIPSTLIWEKDGQSVHVRLTNSVAGQNTCRPEKLLYHLEVACEHKTAFTLTVRIPGWSKKTVLRINGQEVRTAPAGTCEWVDIPGIWQNDTVEVICTQELSLSRLSDTDYYAVQYGPVVLAGLTENDGCLRGIDDACLRDMVRPRSVRDWGVSTTTWEADNGRDQMVMKPLHEINDEIYTVYFKK